MQPTRVLVVEDEVVGRTARAVDPPRLTVDGISREEAVTRVKNDAPDPC
jgi:hypothetical protein